MRRCALRAGWLGVAGLIGGCVSADVAPTVRILSPVDGQVFAGFASVPVRFAVDDDQASVTVEVSVDGELVATVVGSGCNRGCVVSAVVPAEDLAEGEHEITAVAEDLNGRTTDAEPARFEVRDVPYVHSIAVNEDMEGPLDGPGLEVEVHLLHDATAVWTGCAPLFDVQQAGVLHEDLNAVFLANEAGDPVLFTDIGLEVFRVVVIESDGGQHCPIWPALTETLESDVDGLYGISPPIDFSLLYSGPIRPTVSGVTGLEIRRGRPFGR